MSSFSLDDIQTKFGVHFDLACFLLTLLSENGVELDPDSIDDTIDVLQSKSKKELLGWLFDRWDYEKNGELADDEIFERFAITYEVISCEEVCSKYDEQYGVKNTFDVENKIPEQLSEIIHELYDNAVEYLTTFSLISELDSACKIIGKRSFQRKEFIENFDIEFGPFKQLSEDFSKYLEGKQDQWDEELRKPSKKKTKDTKLDEDEDDEKKKKKKKSYVRAKFSWDPSELSPNSGIKKEECLSIKKGTRYEIVSSYNRHMMKGYDLLTGKTGLFPKKLVEPCHSRFFEYRMKCNIGKLLDGETETTEEWELYGARWVLTCVYEDGELDVDLSMTNSSKIKDEVFIGYSVTAPWGEKGSIATDFLPGDVKGFTFEEKPLTELDKSKPLIITLKIFEAPVLAKRPDSLKWVGWIPSFWLIDTSIKTRPIEFCGFRWFVQLTYDPEEDEMEAGLCLPTDNLKKLGDEAVRFNASYTLKGVDSFVRSHKYEEMGQFQFDACEMDINEVDETGFEFIFEIFECPAIKPVKKEVNTWSAKIPAFWDRIEKIKTLPFDFLEKKWVTIFEKEDEFLNIWLCLDNQEEELDEPIKLQVKFQIVDLESKTFPSTYEEADESGGKTEFVELENITGEEFEFKLQLMPCPKFVRGKGKVWDAFIPPFWKTMDEIETHTFKLLGYDWTCQFEIEEKFLSMWLCIDVESEKEVEGEVNLKIKCTIEKVKTFRAELEFTDVGQFQGEEKIHRARRLPSTGFNFKLEVLK
ncbi:hypothetical protein M0813_05672 [Anaeramoeba flamelloides]|uniref:SH3 domain-containing protein n=1 Tax=Anaeramoeba flamelloides TaxID=1746091 RepID=A0ABQ8XJX9_9EUKA|nr:hypothetical protein M0813_05672 [Anaeramoeba flamelloides]